MTDDDPLLLWRLAADLSVVDAAVLIVGANPSDFEALRGYSTWDARQTGSYSVAEDAQAPAGFDAAFAAMRAAILKGNLKAQLTYPQDRRSFATDGLRIITTADLSRVTINGADGSLPGGHILTFQREPHWGASMLDVDDLKAWLRSRGVTTGFFFAKAEAAPADFLDPEHERFAPELALAVSAWTGLADQPSFKRGVKAAIEAWIAANPDAWRGDEPASDSAKERIATVVNWKPKGGMPKAGG